MLSKRKIDHLVYAVSDLEEAMDWLENIAGVRPVFGGYHQTQGTKNALLDLGDESYLEILAMDFENKKINSPRWMGIDLIDSPQITRWALKSTDLEVDRSALKKYNSAMGAMQEGQRKMEDGNLLAWKMLMPLAAPKVELIPFMVDWRNSAIHPTEKLSKSCRLLRLELTHPSPSTIYPVIKELDIDLDIIQGEKIGIKTEIETPNGIIQI